MFDSYRYGNSSIVVGQPANERLIKEAEAGLEVAFPDDYRQFLSLYGWAEVGGDWICGVGANIPVYMDVLANTINERINYLGLLPNYLIPVMNDGGGNYYCIDANHTGLDKPVVFWDDVLAAQAHPPVREAASFSDWLISLCR